MRKRLVPVLGALSLATALAGCEAASIFDGGDSVTGDGIVQYIALEGGFYAIRDVDGHDYDPTNLPAEFRKDGLAVRYSGRVLRDAVGIHMYGQIIELKEISAR
jgi:hypothetical protein